MTTTDELRRTLVENATRAPEGVGLIEAARAGATRVRRRRRIGVGILAVCALVAAVIVRVEVVAKDQPDVVTAPARGLLRLTVDVPWESEYYSTVDKALDAYQSYSVHSGVPGRQGAQVILIDKDAFNPAVLRQGQPITVRGHRGYHVTGPLVEIAGPLRTPEAYPPVFPSGLPKPPGENQIVGWLDPSGVWVLLYGRSRDELVVIARALRIGSERAVRSGVRLGYVPASLRYAEVTATGWPLRFDHVSMGFDAAGSPPRKVTMNELLTTVNQHPLTAEFDVTYAPGGVPVASWPEAVPADIPGLTAWYVGAELAVAAGTCMLTLTSHDPALVPREELVRIAEGAEFADCSRRETWFEIP